LPSTTVTAKILGVVGSDVLRDGVFSCVVDADPGSHLDAIRWFAALSEVAGVSAESLLVQCTRGLESDAIDYLRGRGVCVHVIEPFDTRSKYCNKIAGALALASDGVGDRVVLTDADIAIVKDPRDLIRPGTIGAKVVDVASPPLALFERVFTAAGLALPNVIDPDFDVRAPTVEGHVHRALYLMPGELLPELARAWARWARWLLDRAILGPHAFFADQVAMAMALAEQRIAVSHLQQEWNFPTYVLEWIAPDAKAPAAVRYRHRVEPTGLISTTGARAVDEVIGRVNAAIAGIWHDAFPNQAFWEWRYRSNPTLGSGIGSRGRRLRTKRELLENIVRNVQPASVLDVGCGDGEATQGLPLPLYTGIDISREAIRLARRKRPDGRFHVTKIQDFAGRAELTICFDVLIHVASADEYHDTVAALLQSATRVLLVSGYEHPPSPNSPIVHYHEPLSATVIRAAPEVRCVALSKIHKITAFAVIKPPFDRNWPSLGAIQSTSDDSVATVPH
jgi:SAM-dependent methyltransferase